MIQHAFVVLLSLAPFSAAAAEPQAPQSEKKTEVIDKRPEIEGLLDKLAKHVKKHGSEDTEAIDVIKQLQTEFPKSGPKDQSSIAKAISKCVDAPRAEPKKGEFDDKLAIAAAQALGEMGPESVQPLIGWIGHKTLRHDIELQRQLVLALGKTKDKDAIKTLTLNLENKDAPIVAAAAESLGQFADAKLEVRKDLFSAAIKCLMTAKNAKDAEQAGSGATANTTIATERYDVISAPLMTSLHVLSKHDESTPELWERWWNKNRQANWDSSKP